MSVDPTTGAVAFRGLIPNADRRLLPGLFVNLRLTIGELNQAFLVPQLAVLRDGVGPYVMVARMPTATSRRSAWRSRAHRKIAG